MAFSFWPRGEGRLGFSPLLPEKNQGSTNLVVSAKAVERINEAGIQPAERMARILEALGSDKPDKSVYLPEFFLSSDGKAAARLLVAEHSASWKIGNDEVHYLVARR